MAIIRLFGKFINNLNRYWGPKNETGDKEVVKQWREDWVDTEVNLVHMFLNSCQSMIFFDLFQSLSNNGRGIGVESRDVFKSEDLPHTYHDATIEEDVDHPLDGIVLPRTLPEPSERVRNR